MDDRRRIPRRYLIIYSRVFDQTLGKLLGYLSDLSESGAMIISEEPMTVDSVVPLRFDLPDPKIFQTHNLMITARVAHCVTDISPDFYDIGLEFLEVTQEKKNVLLKMMDVYEFRRDQEYQAYEGL